NFAAICSTDHTGLASVKRSRIASIRSRLVILVSASSVMGCLGFAADHQNAWQFLFRSRESGNPASFVARHWVPAFGGDASFARCSSFRKCPVIHSSTIVLRSVPIL